MALSKERLDEELKHGLMDGMEHLMRMLQKSDLKWLTDPTRLNERFSYVREICQGEERLARFEITIKRLPEETE